MGQFRGHNLFYALRPPDADAVSRVHGLARQLNTDLKLRAGLILEKHLHVSLQGIYGGMDLPAEVLAKARRAAALVDGMPFELVFDRIQSFHGAFDQPALVLRGSEQENFACRLFQQQMRETLLAAGYNNLGRRDFEPHCTLLYSDAWIKDPILVDPIKWCVNSFTLIDSLQGLTKYEFLGDWPLVQAHQDLFSVPSA
jgi:2'-5' RNA ligase